MYLIVLEAQGTTRTKECTSVREAVDTYLAWDKELRAVTPEGQFLANLYEIKERLFHWGLRGA